MSDEGLNKYDVLLQEPQTEKSTFVVDTDYRTFDIPERNAHEYICGYLLKKCLKIHSCEVCIKYIQEDSSINENRLFLRMKAYNTTETTFGSLCVPPPTFNHYINVLNNIFQDHFPNIADSEKPEYFMKLKLKQCTFHHPCKHFQYDYLLSLYIRFKIFSTLKVVSSNLKDSSNKKQKMQILMHL